LSLALPARSNVIFSESYQYDRGGVGKTEFICAVILLIGLLDRQRQAFDRLSPQIESAAKK
jgi:hypothetical protein